MDTPHTAQDWVSVFTAPTDYEADLVRDRLGDAGIEAVVHTQRDHAFNLTVGNLAEVHVMVRPDRLGEARALVDAPAVSDAELEAQALAADPLAPDAHTPENEARLDSGPDGLSLAVPDGATTDASQDRTNAARTDGPDALHVPPRAASTVRVYDASGEADRRA